MIDMDALIESIKVEIEMETELMDEARSGRSLNYHMGKVDALDEILQAIQSC